ncbi:MAG: double-strand break repair helicase AddA [Alphaproteobacteria bacterium]
MSAAQRTRLPRRRIDAPQRNAADPGGSVWVAASAGTGKTKVLTDRVLRLLLDGAPPEKLLCLTFTRAAAAEMANRINAELGRWTTDDDPELDANLEALTGTPPDDALRRRARRLFAAVLDAPGGLKIMTIHAFCQSLLGRFPVEAGIAPHFDVLDERAAAELMYAAQESVLGSARAGRDALLGDALAEVAGHTDEGSFRDLLERLRGLRGRLRALIAANHGLDGLIAATFRLLGVEAGETVDNVLLAACAEGAFNREALGAAVHALKGGSTTDRKRGTQIACWLAASRHERPALFEDYKKAFLTAAGVPRKDLMTKAVREGNPEAFEALLVEQMGLARVIERRNAVIVARATAALLRLGGAMLDAYDRRKRVIARLDYDDLILGAMGLLERRDAAPWVLYKLDGGLDHILVDEAQDTSPEQWRVIAAIADEFFAGRGTRETARTLFVVGDEKQSIFSFQGADLDELDRVRAHFRDKAAAERRWREVPLDRSFRSVPAVLRAVDAVFALAGARDGVAFADHAIRHSAERKGHAGRVELWPVVGPAEDADDASWAPPLARKPSERPNARLAGHIAATVGRWLDAGEILESRGRSVRAGDILVLVRTRSAFVGELLRALKARGVAVAGSDRMVLGDQLAVMDLTALAEFLLLPDDDLTLACVLKGPLIGLDEDALFDLAYGRKGGLWRELVRRRDERADFARAHDTLAGLLARADFTPPYELFADLLGAGKGRRRLVARLGPDANDPIDEFLALALDYERVAPPSLQGFLHWVATGDDQIKRDLDQGRDEVRVMTIHGAKGLEAPIVFLPDTTTVPRSQGPQILWRDAAPEALLWPVRTGYYETCCRAASDAMRERDMQEYRRLLYVAMTRAADRLYVCGWRGKHEMPGDCWYRLIETGLAPVAEPFAFDGGDGWRGQGLQLVDRQTRKLPTPAAARAATAAPAALPGFAREAPAPEPAPPWPLAPSRPESAEAAPLSPLAAGDDGARFRRGRLIHRLLELLPDLAPETRAEACRLLLARHGHDLDDDAQAAVAAEVLAVLEDSRFAALFGPGSRAEAPLVGVIGDRTVTGQVDRLVVLDDEVMVVDYKSNREPPASPAGVDPAYLDQMAAYRAVLSRIYPDKTITCALLWSEGPKLMVLDPALLAARTT